VDFAVVVRQATERDEVMHELAGPINRTLTRELGVPRVELRMRRLEAELGEKTGRVRLEGTRYVVAVASGKGGVGKSTVAANLALALHRLGMTVGLLDADIYGPSVPMMFGVGEERPRAAGGQNFYPVERYGVKLISMGFFLTDKTPVIWRGPMVWGAVRQFLKDTLWGTQYFLIVDLPPGTGDAQLTLAQQVALDGAVIVTTPQDVALLEAYDPCEAHSIDAAPLCPWPRRFASGATGNEAVFLPVGFRVVRIPVPYHDNPLVCLAGGDPLEQVAIRHEGDPLPPWPVARCEVLVDVVVGTEIGANARQQLLHFTTSGSVNVRRVKTA
jgi:Mrp family chromosome partitioning ATPase